MMDPFVATLVCCWIAAFGLPILGTAVDEIEFMQTDEHWSDIPGEVL